MTPFSEYVRAMGRGPSRGRNLTREEARDALSRILAGEVAPEAVGALFMLMRYRGETAAEVAGFVEALRSRSAGWAGIGARVDWPSYAAGRTRGAPYFLLAARLVAASGRPVLIHGWNSHHAAGASVAAAVAALGLPVAREPAAARAALEAGGLAYVPLEALDARALELLRLRDVLGLRSPINTALRGYNPAGAETSVQGVFHPVYRELQADAAVLLGQTRLGAIKGGGGEFERHPGKPAEMFGVAGGARFDATLPPALETPPRKLAEEGATPEDVVALWTGARRDPFAEAVVTGTAAAALFASGLGEAQASEQAQALWAGRSGRAAA